MTTKVDCPLGDKSKCVLRSSLELSGDRGMVQITCGTCGHGQSLALEAAAAEELHAAMHKHVEPPKAAIPEEAFQGQPRKPLGQLPTSH